ncbi:hypothetical protein [Pseudomonas sp. NPDC089734]|uniref:hypothetical protein n=1 Tax=Pseudomonas sp. NPDC089734 TaxID=3364469 RepID=UPI0037F60FB6
MPITATDMAHIKPVGELTTMYLKKCGYSVEKIDSWTSETRLLHDLGLCGDDILDEFKILQDEFGVDLSDFEFKEYFPSELSKDACVISVHRLLHMVGLHKIADCAYKKVVGRTCSKYAEVSFGMIESTLRQKRWIPDRSQ